MGGKRTLADGDAPIDFQLLDRDRVPIESAQRAQRPSAYDIYLEGVSLGPSWGNLLPHLVTHDEARASGLCPHDIRGRDSRTPLKEVILLEPHNPRPVGHEPLGKRKTGDQTRGLSFGAILFEAAVHARQIHLGAVERLLLLASAHGQRKPNQNKRAHIAFVTYSSNVRNGSRADLSRYCLQWVESGR